MKMTTVSKLVKQQVFDLISEEDVDVSACKGVVDHLFKSAPEIKADTIEQADKLVREVMDWQKALPNMGTGAVTLSFKEIIVLAGLMQQRLDEMHLAVETLLYDLGVVERGEENTQTSDTD